MAPKSQLVIMLCTIFVIVYLQITTIEAAGSTEPCVSSAPVDIIQACTYLLKGPPRQPKINHFRNCTVDIFMSLCSILHPEKVNFNFMCTSPNYCLGCRYSYGNCVNESGSDEQEFYLSWYDGITLGGKYTVCDIGKDTLNETLMNDQCFNESRDALDNCALDYMGLFESQTAFKCDAMEEKMNCFLHLLNGCATHDAYNIFYRYLKGINSLTQCNGQMAVFAAGFKSLANLVLILTCAIGTLTFNKLFG